jgi:hypothetical protein
MTIIPVTRTFYVQRVPITVHNTRGFIASGPADFLLQFYEPFIPPFGEFVPLTDAFPFYNAALAQEAADRLQTADYRHATIYRTPHHAYTVYRTIARAQWPHIHLDDSQQISA